MALTQEQIELFEENKFRKIIIDTIELSHPSMTQTYALCRNTSNMMLTKEDGVRQEFIAQNFNVSLPSFDTKATTAIQLSIDIVNSLVAEELEAVMLDTTRTPLKLIYRAYTDQNTYYPIQGPLSLEITNFSIQNHRLSAEARDHDMINKTFPAETFTANKYRGLVYV